MMCVYLYKTKGICCHNQVSGELNGRIMVKFR